MSDKNIDMMKKWIAAKKQKSSKQNNTTRFEKSIGEQRTGIKKYKKGGLFDK